MPKSVKPTEPASHPQDDAPQVEGNAAVDAQESTPTPAEKDTDRNGRTPDVTVAPATVVPAKSNYLKILNRDRPMAWLVLAALLLLTAMPIYSYLQSNQTLSESQLQALALAEESWHHRHMLYQGEVKLESLVPVSDGIPQLGRPPGDVWLYQIAFRGLDPLTATQNDLIHEMRLLSAGFGLLTIAAIFWAGFSIGGLMTASYAGLIALSCPVFAWYSRQGTVEIPLLGFQTLAVASAMWALRPLRPTPAVSRQALGWAVCGFALGSAVLTGGLSAIAVVVLPVLVMSIMCPKRISHLLGLVASVCIAGLMLIPWAMYVHSKDTGIWEVWAADLWPNRINSFTILGESLYDRGLLALALVLPWTFWLLGSLAQPFSASSRGVRRRVFIGWAWLITVGMLVVIGPSKNGMGGLLIMLPAAALLIGQCLRLFSDRSAEGRHARVWRYTRWGHMTFIVVASVAVPAGMLFQDNLVQREIFSGPIVAPTPWYFWLGLGVSLMLITLMSMRFALRHYPGKATICWSLWSVVLLSVMLIPVSRGPMMNPVPEKPPADTQPPLITLPADS